MSRRNNRGLFAAARDVDDISREHLMCRDLGHQWVPYMVERVSQRRHWREVLACSRCSTYRTRFLDDRGLVISSSYAYADGYARVGQGAWTADLRASVRIASLQLMFDTDTVPTNVARPA